MAPELDRLRAQDHAAFDAVVACHYARIAHYLARLVGDRDIAAELTQDAFLRAYQALPTLAENSDVGAWLYRIATNLARQHHRHGQLICWSRLEPHHAPGRGMEDDVAQQDQVRRALSKLTLDQRVCLLLYAWTGYTCAEIGEITGKSTNAVRMLLVRARRRFRAAYGAGAMQDGLDGTLEDTDMPDGLGGSRGRDDSSTRGVSGRGCGAVDHLLPLYPRGDLPVDDFVEVTRHLAGCERCRAALREVQAIYRLVQRHLNTAEVAVAAPVPEVYATVYATAPARTSSSATALGSRAMAAPILARI